MQSIKQMSFIVHLLLIAIIPVCLAEHILFPTNFKDAIVQLHDYNEFFRVNKELSATNRVDVSTSLVNGFYKIKQLVTHKLLNNELPLTIANVSSECQEQVNYVLDGLQNGKNFAIRFFDSFGKPPSGILNGNLAWLGEFGECRNITSSYGNLTGKYCILSKPIDATGFFRPNLTLSLKYGICVPKVCSQNDIYEIVNYIIDSIPPNVTNALPFKLKISLNNVNIQEERELDRPAIVVLCIIGFIVFIVLMGTLVDFYKRYQFYLKCKEMLSNSTSLNESSNLVLSDIDGNDELDSNSENVYQISISQEHIGVQVLIGFSAYTNTKKLFKINDSNDQLKCLDAIRFLSISWVILGHCYIIIIGFSDNPFKVPEFIKRFSFLVISNAFFSVDTFFLMSGLLTSYVFLRQAEKQNNRISVFFMIKYYLHRYWRVTPPYLMAIIISTYLSGYFGVGPLYPLNGYEPDFCPSYWWRNILYINNIENSERWCFGVSWYLANDMQFHWLAPIILIPLAMGKKFISAILTVLILCGNIIAIALTLNFNEGIEAAQFGQKAFHDFFMKFYILPWCRIGPYIIGLLLGYALFLYKKKIVFKINKYANVSLWIMSIFLCGLLVFGLYPDAKAEDPLSRETHIFYQSFSKITWSLSVGFMIYACVSLNGGIINDILSWKVWVPLSRLTYGAFLTHVAVLIYFNATQEHLVHLQDSTLIYFFLANLVFSFATSYLFSLFFEIPLIGLEKFIFKK